VVPTTLASVLLHSNLATAIATRPLGDSALSGANSGSDNTATGVLALEQNSTGNDNTATGSGALQGNTIGNGKKQHGRRFRSPANGTTGSNNVAVGFDAGLNLKAGNNNIILDANVPGTASDANTIRIGKQGTQQKTFIAGISGKTVASGVGVIINSSGQLGTVQSSHRKQQH
jgi:hypothetical protein